MQRDQNHCLQRREVIYIHYIILIMKAKRSTIIRQSRLVRIWFSLRCGALLGGSLALQSQVPIVPVDKTLRHIALGHADFIHLQSLEVVF